MLVFVFEFDLYSAFLSSIVSVDGCAVGAKFEYTCRMAERCSILAFPSY